MIHQKSAVEILRNAIAATLSVTIQDLGFMSEEHGSAVKKLLSGNDDVALLALGCALDECREKREWQPLQKTLDDIQRLRSKGLTDV